MSARARVSRALRVTTALTVGVVVSGHVGSPDVFFVGPVGPYSEILVTVRPPQVVPGIARVTVRAPFAKSVAIRPVFWRAGSKGAPSADEMRRVGAGQFEGSLWLMASGAYSVDVIVDGDRGPANVLVPVASVATGRLAMNIPTGILLAALGLVLCAGLVTIVYKGAGQSLVEAGGVLDSAGRRTAARAVAVAVPLIALALLGGARWWNAVDQQYQRTIYRPSPLHLSLNEGVLHIALSDTVWQPSGPSALIPDHGKLMHLFLVRKDDPRGFAHLHPRAADSSAIPEFDVVVPSLPAGDYHTFADVVHETGFERTLVGSVTIPASLAVEHRLPQLDADDATWRGQAAIERETRLTDGSFMSIEMATTVPARRENSFMVRVRSAEGGDLALDPYLGMPAHAVVTNVDGSVYVHLHPMGTVSSAAQRAFLARERGDTTASGRLLLDHAAHGVDSTPSQAADRAVAFRYAFPKPGNYRLFVQVKRNGKILTGAFAITVVDGESSR